MSVDASDDSHSQARGGRADEPSSDELLLGVLESAGTIAVVGVKDDPSEDAYRIPLYMHEHGYRILPVNPKLARVFGEPAVASLAAVDEPVDVVNLFRGADHIPAHVDEILTLSPLPKAVWMQLGIVHGGAAARLRAAGITVVQDRCIMVDHRRLIG